MLRDGGNADVRWFDVEPCYVFHPLNAYDENGAVVVDVARHPKMFATDIYGPAELPPTLDRWTIELDAGKVMKNGSTTGRRSSRVNDRAVGRHNRYGYTTHFGVDDEGDPSRWSGEARPANRRAKRATLVAAPTPAKACLCRPRTTPAKTRAAFPGRLRRGS